MKIIGERKLYADGSSDIFSFAADPDVVRTCRRVQRHFERGGAGVELTLVGGSKIMVRPRGEHHD